MQDVDRPDDVQRLAEPARSRRQRVQREPLRLMLCPESLHGVPTNLWGRRDWGSSRPLAEELGMRPVVAHCHLGLGELYRRTSKREQAREHLATATTMYREMGMTYWLEKAEAEVTNLRT
jgi:hypothetical protein